MLLLAVTRRVQAHGPIMQGHAVFSVYVRGWGCRRQAGSHGPQDPLAYGAWVEGVRLLPQGVNAGLPQRSARETLRGYADYMASRRREVRCFQIGANDGRITIRVYVFFKRYGWYGLLVEPQVDVFERDLIETYRGYDRVQLANVAIADRQGTMPFYRLAVSNARWATGLSGFSRASIDGHTADGFIARRLAEEGKVMPSNPGDLLEVRHVPTTTVGALLSERAFPAFDVLCVDTEGYDYRIIKLFDFEQYRPDLVLFESKHLSHDEFGSLRGLLADYVCYADKGDTFAVRRDSAGAEAVQWMDRPAHEPKPCFEASPDTVSGGFGAEACRYNAAWDFREAR